MGTFHISCKIENTVRRERSAVVSKVLVDTGSENTWIPAESGSWPPDRYPPRGSTC